MSKPTAVNEQITDAVTQANVKVVAEAPAVAMATLYEATARAMSIAAENAANAQQAAQASSQAATNQGVIQIYGSAADEQPTPASPQPKGGRKS